MTYEEALSEIQRLFSHWLRIESKYRDDKEGEALVMAEQAIEKQIPKKPKNIRFSRDYRLAEHNIQEGDCPVCGETVTGNYYGEYCGCCGQKLDWSE